MISVRLTRSAPNRYFVAHALHKGKSVRGRLRQLPGIGSDNRKTLYTLAKTVKRPGAALFNPEVRIMFSGRQVVPPSSVAGALRFEVRRAMRRKVVYPIRAVSGLQPMPESVQGALEHRRRQCQRKLA